MYTQSDLNELLASEMFDRTVFYNFLYAWIEAYQGPDGTWDESPTVGEVVTGEKPLPVWADESHYPTQLIEEYREIYHRIHPPGGSYKYVLELPQEQIQAYFSRFDYEQLCQIFSAIWFGFTYKQIAVFAHPHWEIEEMECVIFLFRNYKVPAERVRKAFKNKFNTDRFYELQFEAMMESANGEI